MKNRPLFYLGHPAHYHLFKGAINDLIQKRVTVSVVIKKKDVLENLVKAEGWEYITLVGNPKSHQLIVRFYNIFRLLYLWLIVFFRGRTLLIGSAAELALIGRTLKRESLVFFEDDLNEVPLFAKLAGPNASMLICPISCSAGKWESRSFKYPSYHELAYLHPNNFTPDITRLPSAIDTKRPFYILRFSDLQAYHDVGKSGITDEVAIQLIAILESHGQVFITSERKLSASLERYRISISPELIHHALYFADLFIGDSQTMTAECAVLGTMSFRYNGFVGRLGYLEELEHKYDLTKGVLANDPHDLISLVSQYLEAPYSNEEMTMRRKRMLSEMVDLNELLKWLIEKYPDSRNSWKMDNTPFLDFIKT